MSNPTSELIDRLATPEETGTDPALLVPLLHLLAHGEPVTADDLASAAGRTAEQVHIGLAAVPDTEYDDQGRVVSQGLTLRPTPHRFSIDGEDPYTWCALDTLIFPALIGATASAESKSPVSGQPIRLTATPSQVTDVEPPTAVVSLVNPKNMTSIRSSVCNQVHFFTSAEDAQTWLTEHPGAEVRPVADAFQLGLSLTEKIRDRPNADAATPVASDAGQCCG